jgi:hypothetical protein
MHHLLGWSRFTIGDIRISKSMKHESRLGGRLREKRASAILAAYMYRRYQNRAKWQEPRTALTCSIFAN